MADKIVWGESTWRIEAELSPEFATRIKALVARLGALDAPITRSVRVEVRPGVSSGKPSTDTLEALYQALLLGVFVIEKALEAE